MDFWIDFASFLGILILALPTLKLNKLKRQQTLAVEKAKRAATMQPDGLTAKVAELLVEKRKEDFSTWKQTDQMCLFSGYILLLGSNLFRLLPL